MTTLQKPKTNCALALMATVPVPGVAEVKTRLVPPLTPDEAAELKICFGRDVAASVGEIVDARRAEGMILFSPIAAKPTLREVAPKGFKLFLQRGNPLGEVLANAAEDLLSRGFPSVCLINSDTPTLPRSWIEVAIESLSRPGDRVVVGAVDGGGYYLIGLKQEQPRLFDRISSSTANVVAHMTARAAEIGLKVEMLPPWYEVVDRQTLNRLCEELLGLGQPSPAAFSRDRAHTAPYTRRYLTRLIETGDRERFTQGKRRF